MGLTNILGFLGDDILLDDIIRKRVYAMEMNGGSGGLSRG
jgi:hypothetical protein